MNKLRINHVMDDDGLTAIASCVTNIESLSITSIAGNKATAKGIRALAQEILKRKKPVRCYSELD